MSREVDVAIVGAGAAGIAAARRLAREPLSVLVLEAGDRIGGRARTAIAGGYPLDLGCGWLHSADRSPLPEVAGQLGYAVDRTPPPWGEQVGHQGMSAAEQMAFGAAYDGWEQRVLAATEDGPADRFLEPDGRWNPLIEALSGWINGVETGGLSTRDYAAYTNAATDENWRVPRGMGAMIAAAGAELPVELGCAVTGVALSGSGVVLSTAAGPVTARVVIVTISTALLAAGAIRFDAAAAPWLEAAAALPLGLADKCVLVFAEPGMFPPDSHLFGRIDRRETGSYHLRPFGRPLIEMFVGGALAEQLEQDGERAFAGFAIDELADLIGSDMRRLLKPVAATRWRANSLALGSYSHARPGNADARAALARPCEGRLFFAGEATSPQDFSTAHGAWTSGEAAAEQVIAALRA